MSSSPESKLHFLDYWRTIRIRKGLICLIFLLVVITVGVLTYLSPKEYLSFATIEVQPDMTPVRIFNNTQTDDTAHDPKFTQTQFQIILRKGVLYPVIERLRLQKNGLAKVNHYLQKSPMIGCVRCCNCRRFGTRT